MIDFIVSIDEHSEELDGRQPWKIRYPLFTILFLVFVSQLAGVETWKEMKDFIDMHEAILRILRRKAGFSEWEACLFFRFGQELDLRLF